VNVPFSTEKMDSFCGRYDDLGGMGGLRYSMVNMEASKASNTQSPFSRRLGARME